MKFLPNGHGGFGFFYQRSNPTVDRLIDGLVLVFEPILKKSPYERHFILGDGLAIWPSNTSHQPIIGCGGSFKLKMFFLMFMFIIALLTFICGRFPDMIAFFF